VRLLRPTPVHVTSQLAGDFPAALTNAPGESNCPSIEEPAVYLSTFPPLPRRSARPFLGWIAIFVIVGWLPSHAFAQTVRVSVSSAAEQGNAQSGSPLVSADGRYVAFSSWAANLVMGDTNGVADAFVHDRVTGATTRVSVASNGTQGNSASYPSSISADGRYVAFQSSASNLVAGDVNRSGFIGGLYLREDGANVPTKQVCPGTA
jgi:hypothetical protein